MTSKNYLSKLPSIDESVKLSDEKMEQIEGGKCETTCKKCTTNKNGGHEILSDNEAKLSLVE